jgi:glycosyltransferase involved in cell wall biosynthesis
MKKPKILFVLPSFVIGGAEIKALNILKSLSAFETLLLSHKNIKEFFLSLEIPIFFFEGEFYNNPNILSPKNIWSYIKSVKKVTVGEKPDIIFGMMQSGGFFVTLAHDLFFLKGFPIMTVEGNISGYFKAIHRRPSLQEKLVLRYSFQRARGIVVPSEGVKNDLIMNYGVAGDKITIIYNGFDLNSIREHGRSAIPFEKDCPWIITACRLDSQKDFRTLLQSFKIVRDTIRSKLFIVGEGELRENIKQMASDLKISEDVVLTGFQHNPFSFISKADVFVLSSLFEGFANVIVEAMALGVPVISTDCPSGPAEIIKDGENGFLVPIGNAERIASICTLLLQDEDLRAYIKDNGSRRADSFSLTKMAEQYNSYFMHLLER